MSQFAFILDEFAALYAPARKAELDALSDPRSACCHARIALELALNWMYRHDSALKPLYQDNLNALLQDAALTALTGPALVAKAKIIKDRGNQAVHDAKPPTAAEAAVVLRELFHICYWLDRKSVV